MLNIICQRPLLKRAFTTAVVRRFCPVSMDSVTLKDINRNLSRGSARTTGFGGICCPGEKLGLILISFLALRGYRGFVDHTFF